MKIIINYDLLSKVSEANSGFALDKSIKHILKCSLVVESICIPIYVAGNYSFVDIIKDASKTLAFQSLWCMIIDLLFSKFEKQIALEQLKKLTKELKNININTNYELLLNSYKDQTRYKLEKNNSFIPKIKQEKYIIVPINENGEEKEISILQEHVIGSRNYVLSRGTCVKQKSLKLVFNSL